MSESKLISELAAVGTNVNNVYDLVKQGTSYPQTVPILVNALDYDDLNDRTIEGIIRALAVKEAKAPYISNKLLRKFFLLPPEKWILRWVIGSTIDVIAGSQDVPEIIRIVTDRSNGSAREMFVHALRHFDDPQVLRVLCELLNDEEVAAHALIALRHKQLPTDIQDKIVNLLKHPNARIRREAKRTHEKMASNIN